jgi:hypothetical protein
MKDRLRLLKRNDRIAAGIALIALAAIVPAAQAAERIVLVEYFGRAT